VGLNYDNGGDYDTVDVCHVETLKARVNHRCTDCYAIIEAGQFYERTASLFDGRWSTYRKCQHCMAFESTMEQHYRGFAGGNAFGCMYEEIRNTLNDLYSVDHPGRWFSVARKLIKVRKNYEDQIKRGVVDKSGRGNKVVYSMFGWKRNTDQQLISKRPN